MFRGQPELLLGQGVPVVAATLDYAVHQFVAGLRDVGDTVSGVLERVKHQHRRRRCVQSHRIPDAGILGGVVAEDERDFLLGVELQR